MVEQIYPRENGNSGKNPDKNKGKITSVYYKNGDRFDYCLDEKNRLLRVAIYNKEGKIMKFYDYTKTIDSNETREAILDPIKMIITSDVVKDSLGEIKRFNVPGVINEEIKKMLEKNGGRA